MFLIKIMPYNVDYGLVDNEEEGEGRLITAEYSTFYLVCVYVPNSGRKLVTLPKRMRWNVLFMEHLHKLNAKKPVIVCGDMNVSHLEIGNTLLFVRKHICINCLKHTFRPCQSKYEQAQCRFHGRRARRHDETAGQWLCGHLSYAVSGPATCVHLLDVYGQCSGSKYGMVFQKILFIFSTNAISLYSSRRLDYFLVSERIKSKVVDNVIQSKVMGSDHCPITLKINI